MTCVGVEENNTFFQNEWFQKLDSLEEFMNNNNSYPSKGDELFDWFNENETKYSENPECDKFGSFWMLVYNGTVKNTKRELNIDDENNEQHKKRRFEEVDNEYEKESCMSKSLHIFFVCIFLYLSMNYFNNA